MVLVIMRPGSFTGSAASWQLALRLARPADRSPVQARLPHVQQLRDEAPALVGLAASGADLDGLPVLALLSSTAHA